MRLVGVDDTAAAPVAKITSDPVAVSNTLVQKWPVIAA
jgi:hypothetical protein